MVSFSPWEKSFSNWRPLAKGKIGGQGDTFFPGSEDKSGNGNASRARLFFLRATLFIRILPTFPLPKSPFFPSDKASFSILKCLQRAFIIPHLANSCRNRRIPERRAQRLEMSRSFDSHARRRIERTLSSHCCRRSSASSCADVRRQRSHSHTHTRPLIHSDCGEGFEVFKERGHFLSSRLEKKTANQAEPDGSTRER